MSAIWGIHNDKVPAEELLAGAFVSIAWDRIGDLARVGDDQQAMRDVVRHAYPDAKIGAVPVWAGVLRRFAFQMAIGDIVIAPDKATSTINIGRVTGGYQHLAEVREHRHRRAVSWLVTAIPRTRFSQPALHEIGSALTLFQVRNHGDEFLAALRSKPSPSDEVVAVPQPQVEDEGVAAELAAEEPSARKVLQYTQDFVATTLLQDLSHEEFEHFVADLLRAMGYQARVTQYSGDGGVDVIAHRDPLGLEPPLIKVQVKHSDATRGSAEVNQLVGTLTRDELGLFVTLGTYSKDATALERQKSQLRLISGIDLVELVLEHYEGLPETWRSRIPLRRVLVVNRDSEGR